MRFSGKFFAGIIVLALVLTVIAQEYLVRIDVAGDGVIERSFEDSSEWPQTVSEPYAFSIAAASCSCSGCAQLEEDGVRYCMVPVAFSSTHEGVLTVDDALVEQARLSQIAGVDYGETFGRNIGGCWRVDYVNIDDPLNPFEDEHVFSVPDDIECDIYFTYKKDDSAPPETNDALVDATYRLLNQTLDSNQDGVLDEGFSPGMIILVDPQIRGQAMWGPLEVRLLTWI